MMTYFDCVPPLRLRWVVENHDSEINKGPLPFRGDLHSEKQGTFGLSYN